MLLTIKCLGVIWGFLNLFFYSVWGALMGPFIASSCLSLTLRYSFVCVFFFFNIFSPPFPPFCPSGTLLQFSSNIWWFLVVSLCLHFQLPVSLPVCRWVLICLATFPKLGATLKPVSQFTGALFINVGQWFPPSVVSQFCFLFFSNSPRIVGPFRAIHLVSQHDLQIAIYLFTYVCPLDSFSGLD